MKRHTAKTKTEIEATVQCLKRKWLPAMLANNGRTKTLQCALCDYAEQMFMEKNEMGYYCDSCPVKKATGKVQCQDTPFYKHRAAITDTSRQKEARKEVDFLLSLLPEGYEVTFRGYSYSWKQTGGKPGEFV